MTSSQEWSKTTLTTLFHGLALSPADASSLVPQTMTQIENLVRRLSVELGNPVGWTTQRHTRAVVKRVTGLTPPPKGRKKKLVKAPKHRISIQLIPATPADDAAVRNVGGYPFVEVVLKGGRRVWDVVTHLYQKWGLPVRVEVDRKAVSVDSVVCELLEKGRTVRVPYRVLWVNIDWGVLKSVLDSGVAVNGKKRVLAPPDDTFWEALEAGKEGVEDVQEKCVFRGEEAVLSRLRGHLQRLESCEQDQSQTELETDGKELDPTVIPERFLRSCSKFEFANSLPDSLLSLGRSEGKADDDALQVMNDALDLRHHVRLACDEELGDDFAQVHGTNDLPVTSPQHSLSLQSLSAHPLSPQHSLSGVLLKF